MSQKSWIMLASHSGLSLALRLYPKWRSGGSLLHTASEVCSSCTLVRGKGWCAGDVTSTSPFVTPNKFWISRWIQWMLVWSWWLYRPGAHCRSAIWFCAKREHGGHVNSRRENWPHVPYANMSYRNNQLLLRYFLMNKNNCCVSFEVDAAV